MSWLHFIRIHSVLIYTTLFNPIANLQEAISLVIRHHIKAEIIGQWLYCFPSLLIGFQLEAVGFWYSFKHGAYIFAGKPKEGNANDETLDEIRARLGSQQVRG
jgi:hypothetical protein